MTKEKQEYLNQSQEIYEKYLEDETQFIMTKAEREHIKKLCSAYKEYLNYEKELESFILFVADNECLDDKFILEIETKLKQLDAEGYNQTSLMMDALHQDEDILQSQDAKAIHYSIKGGWLIRTSRQHRYIFSANQLFLRCYFPITQ